ncbi:helicase associated domain-containing protein [Streptomyces sp. NPDC088745]|uniref:helicase associated domain-containing protein n=1 Tax=Streptomyces sp. NPDC088745 TaxID=3365884 RepID=UPI0038048006
MKRTRDDKWRLTLAAAKAFHAREGHLRVPRKHVESVESHGAGDVQSGSGGLGVVDVKLGMVLDNIRKRADKLPAERRAELDALGMRWTTAKKAAAR